MWNYVLSILIPMAIHLGVEELLAKFPNLPAWLVTILRQLEGAKQQAYSLPSKEREQAVTVARAKAAAQIHAVCKGADCNF